MSAFLARNRLIVLAYAGMVVLLLVMAVFAEFLAPMDPKATDVGFA
ncbi:ABC transporter permease, partial [Mesorhizobium sp. M8A.F.Ca.ET.059.01.1.1]